MKPAYRIPLDEDRGYSPLGSVWEGEDFDLIERMLDIYPRKNPENILDATVNGARFWRGSARPIVRSGY